MNGEVRERMKKLLWTDQNKAKCKTPKYWHPPVICSILLTSQRQFEYVCVVITMKPNFFMWIFTVFLFRLYALRGWKVKVKVTQSCPTLCDPMDSTVHGILQARVLEWVPFPFSRGSSQPRDRIQVSRIAWEFFTSLPSQPRDRTQVSCIAGGFFASWATREAKNTGVGIHALLQQIFPTQESNWGLLHRRRILYPLSYQGNAEDECTI